MKSRPSMVYKVLFSKEAKKDFDEISSSLNSGLRNDFFLKIKEFIDQVCLFPNIFPIYENEQFVKNNIRRCAAIFYNIFYLVDEQNSLIYIVKIFHQNRKPLKF